MRFTINIQIIAFRHIISYGKRKFDEDFDGMKFTLDNWMFTNCGEIHYK